MRWLLLILVSGLALACNKPPQDVVDARNPSPKETKAVAPLADLDAYPGALEVSRKQRDEGGFHIAELDLSTSDSAEKVAAFYEPKLKAKSMPMGSGILSIQNDFSGKHYEVTYSRMGEETTISMIVKTPSP